MSAISSNYSHEKAKEDAEYDFWKLLRTSKVHANLLYAEWSEVYPKDYGKIFSNVRTYTDDFVNEISVNSQSNSQISNEEKINKIQRINKLRDLVLEVIQERKTKEEAEDAAKQKVRGSQKINPCDTPPVGSIEAAWNKFFPNISFKERYEYLGIGKNKVITLIQYENVCTTLNVQAKEVYNCAEERLKTDIVEKKKTLDNYLFLLKYSYEWDKPIKIGLRQATVAQYIKNNGVNTIDQTNALTHEEKGRLCGLSYNVEEHSSYQKYESDSFTLLSYLQSYPWDDQLESKKTEDLDNFFGSCSDLNPEEIETIRNQFITNISIRTKTRSIDTLSRWINSICSYAQKRVWRVKPYMLYGNNKELSDLIVLTETHPWSKLSIKQKELNAALFFSIPLHLLTETQVDHISSYFLSKMSAHIAVEHQQKIRDWVGSLVQYAKGFTENLADQLSNEFETQCFVWNELLKVWNLDQLKEAVSQLDEAMKISLINLINTGIKQRFSKKPESLKEIKSLYSKELTSKLIFSYIELEIASLASLDIDVSPITRYIDSAKEKRLLFLKPINNPSDVRSLLNSIPNKESDRRGSVDALLMDAKSWLDDAEYAMFSTNFNNQLKNLDVDDQKE